MKQSFRYLTWDCEGPNGACTVPPQVHSTAYHVVSAYRRDRGLGQIVTLLDEVEGRSQGGRA
jgi:hypothetical protein